MVVHWFKPDGSGREWIYITDQLSSKEICLLVYARKSFMMNEFMFLVHLMFTLCVCATPTTTEDSFSNANTGTQTQTEGVSQTSALVTQSSARLQEVANTDETGSTENDCNLQLFVTQGTGRSESAITRLNDSDYQLDIADCIRSNLTTIEGTRGRVHIVNPLRLSEVNCSWTVPVPTDHKLNISFHGLQGKKTMNGTIMVSSRGFETSNLTDVHTYELRSPYLLENVTATQYFRYTTASMVHNSTTLTFTFAIKPFLKVVQQSTTTYILTSPNFDGKKLYPKHADISHTIKVPKDYVILYTFDYFDLGWPCSDYLNITSIGTHKTNQDFFGNRSIGFTWRSEDSLSIRFVTSSNPSTGFKMIYSIMPFSQEPKSQNGFYDCAVPYSDSFLRLFRCNLVVECKGGEDENGCHYDTNNCKGSLEAGHKCYQVFRPEKNISWLNAYFSCSERGQQLVTMATPAEWTTFKTIMNWGTRFNGVPVFVGLHLIDVTSGYDRSLYANVWTWADGRKAFYTELRKSDSNSIPQCVYYRQWGTSLDEVTAFLCGESISAVYVCESEQIIGKTSTAPINFPSLEADLNVYGTSLVPCDSGELTHDFLICDSEGPCGQQGSSEPSCSVNEVEVPMFKCTIGFQTIPYTLVCDHRKDCSDNSDENICRFSKTCRANAFQCRNRQCIDEKLKCDGVYHCVDDSDEMCETSNIDFPPAIPPPFKVDMNGNGRFSLSNTTDCPTTHFLCPGRYCLPVYLRCNRYKDCPGTEDENDCEDYLCPGFYRCRNSQICVHPDNICDSIYQCPEQDDELLCNLTCPDTCFCQGLSFVCPAKFSPKKYPELRYLNADGSGMTPSDFNGNHVLIRLHLSRCHLETMNDLQLPNLRYLDLSQNSITVLSVSALAKLENLQTLILSNNPLSTFMNPWNCEKHHPLTIKQLGLSHTDFAKYNSSVFDCFSNLQTLDMSFSKLSEITKDGFNSTPKLVSLNLSNSPLTVYPFDVLRGLKYLEKVSVDSYKLCCEALLPPQFDNAQCHSEQDHLASCKDLLYSASYRICLWFFAILSLCGNVGSFFTRLYLEKKGSLNMGSFGIFVTNLSIADFLMGVYLTIIGTADQMYRGIYVWNEAEWRGSMTCKIAGFLCLLSSEVSVLNICLITLDRFLVLRFPFSKLHFQRKSAAVACVLIWTLGTVLAAIPLLPITSHWNFYGQSGICIPLPFSKNFPGYRYSFAIMIISNFVLFLLIALGQIVIYFSVRTNSLMTQDSACRNATIARRLTAVVVSDFCCWFPIGLIGVMGKLGTPIPSFANVVIAIFILPFNSALNPFLYTLNILMERRRKAKEARYLKLLESRCVTKTFKLEEKSNPSAGFSKELAMKQLDAWLTNELLTPEDVVSSLTPFITCETDPSTAILTDAE